MSCVSTNSPIDSYYFFNNKTYYSIHFKDNTTAYVLKDSLLHTIQFHIKSIESIVKFNYDKDLDIHNEFVLFSDDMRIFGDEYMKIYENLHEMYGCNPLDDFDHKIIIQLNNCQN